MTSREAWVRFACALFIETESSASEIAKEADQMLIEYLKRFPDPKEQKSAKLLPKGSDGEPEGMEFTGKSHEAPASRPVEESLSTTGGPLTPTDESPSSREGQS